MFVMAVMLKVLASKGMIILVSRLYPTSVASRLLTPVALNIEREGYMVFDVMVMIPTRTRTRTRNVPK